MTHVKPVLCHLNPILLSKTTPSWHRFHHQQRPSKLTLWWSSLVLFFFILFLFRTPCTNPNNLSSKRRSILTTTIDHNSAVLQQSSNKWEAQVRKSAQSHTGRTVLVTGAAGFVGCHVSIALKLRGDGVVGLDNFNAYYDTSLKKSRRGLLQKHGIHVIKADINDDVLLKQLFETIRFTHVMHLAAQAGVRYAMQNPSSFIHSNVNGFVNLLEACKNASNQPSIVWASSSSVYGLNSKVPFSEKDRTDQPASLYAATKKAGEEIAHSYNHIYGLSITGLRFFTVYGPWGRPDMAYYSFTRDILKGKEIKVFDRAARDFTYIDDIVKGCLSALDTAEKSTGINGKKKGSAQLRIYNLGNTRPISVGDMVRLLEKFLKVKAKKKVLAMPRNGDVMFTHANISLAEKELVYRPSTDLETGLKKFVKWYLDYYGNGNKKKSHSSW